MLFVFYLRDVSLSFASSFLVVNTTWELVVNKPLTAVVIPIGHEHNTKHCTCNFFIGLDVKLLIFFWSFQEAWALTLPSWTRCRPYLFLWILACLSVYVCVQGEGASVCSSLHKKGTLWIKVWCARSRLTGTESGLKQRYSEGEKNKVYILFYIVQNIYRPFVPLKSCSALAMPSALYHVIIIHRLVPMTRGWFDCFFMSSAFFAINAFVLKQLQCSFFFFLHLPAAL